MEQTKRKLWLKIEQRKQQTCCNGRACRMFQRRAFLRWSLLFRTQFQMIQLDSGSTTNPGFDKMRLDLSSIHSLWFHKIHLSVAPDKGPGQKAEAMGWPHLQSLKLRKLIKLKSSRSQNLELWKWKWSWSGLCTLHISAQLHCPKSLVWIYATCRF